jgi:hypothetical protein
VGGSISAIRAGNVRVAVFELRDLAQPALIGGPPAQRHRDFRRGLQRYQELLGDANLHFLLARPCKPDDRLPRADHLPDFGIDGSDDRIMRRTQDRIAGLIAAAARVRLGLQITGLGRIEQRLATVKLGLADEAFRLQVLEAPVVGALLVAVDLCRIHAGVGRLCCEAIVLRIDGGERLTAAHGLPDFDQPLSDAASDLESGASFNAGPDFPGKFSHG